MFRKNVKNRLKNWFNTNRITFLTLLILINSLLRGRYGKMIVVELTIWVWKVWAKVRMTKDSVVYGMIALNQVITGERRGDRCCNLRPRGECRWISYLIWFWSKLVLYVFFLLQKSVKPRKKNWNFDLIIVSPSYQSVIELIFQYNISKFGGLACYCHNRINLPMFKKISTFKNPFLHFIKNSAIMVTSSYNSAS